MTKVALLVGVSEYEPGLNPLPGAVQDVDAVRRVLANPEMGGFAEADITVLQNPQRQEMEDAIYNLFAHRQKDDLALFYFSGHGIKDESGKLYLATRATRKQNGKLVKPSAVAASSLHESINESRSQRQVLILDCCFSGAIAQGLTVKDDGAVDLQTQLGGKGRAILTSSTSTQYSFEQEGAELSIYTRYLVEGIEKGAADQDGDGWISADELHEYASVKVQEAAPAMTPKFFPVEEGYRIRLAKAPVDDPQLRYRKEVEAIVREDEGEIDFLTRLYLDELRDDLGLSAEQAEAIEFEVLEPYRKRQEKLQRYKEALFKVIQHHYPLTEKDYRGLKRLQTILKLRDEDVATIEERVLASERVESQKQAGESQNKRESQSFLPVSQPKSLLTIQTPVFEFEVVTVNAQGQVTDRRQSQAEFFQEDLGNGVILEMVAIPGGQFLMGAPEGEEGRRDNESPQHTVTVQPFFMGKFTITQAQWSAVAALPKIKIDLNPDPSRCKGANRPVEKVSWNDAIEFCARLSIKTGKTYRLPSEAEWEYACRAGTTTPFHFGETITTDLANYHGDYTYGAAPKGEYREQTTDVGSFPPNAFGLYDMHGNIWEWCQDTWHDNYEGAPADASAWINDSDNDCQMLRGGAWDDFPGDCRSASRDGRRHDHWFINFGFRVVVFVPRTP